MWRTTCTGWPITSWSHDLSTSQIGTWDSFLQQFYRLFPHLRSVPFYPTGAPIHLPSLNVWPSADELTGESYAGKYVPAIAYKIHKENAARRPGQLPIPLMGLAIGDGFSDPIAVSNAFLSFREK